MSNELFMGGTRLYQRDQAELAQMAANTALLQERTRNEAADRELNPLRAELLRGQATHQGTLADLNRAQAGEIAAKQSREERVAATIAAHLGRRRRPTQVQFDDDGNLMPQPEPSEGQGMDDLAGAGFAVMAAGDLKKGEELIKLAAELRHKDAQTRASAAAEKVRLANTQVKKLTFMQEILSGVTDQASHARAVLLLQGNGLTGDEKLPKWLETYDQAKINQFVKGSDAMIKKKELEIKGFNAESADTSRKATQRVREYLAGLAKQRTDAYVERTRNLEKAGGAEKTVPMPSSAEMNMLKKELADEGIEFEAGEGDDAAIAELAEQVKILTARNTSLSRKEAVARVLKEAEGRGDLTRGKPAERFPLFGGKIPGTGAKSKYNQTEGTVAVPLPLPNSPTELKEGSYYRADTGEIRQYKGGAFVPISKAASKPGKGK